MFCSGTCWLVDKETLLVLKHIHFTFIFDVSFPFIRVEVLVHSVFTLEHLEAIVPEGQKFLLAFCGKTSHG